MNLENTSHYSVEKLRRELAAFKVSFSPLSAGFSLERMFAKVTAFKVVKANQRRQVFLLQTKDDVYFLKRSTLIRTKDRLRHFFLPRRRWAEWRNFHRLQHAQIAVPTPLCKGENRSGKTKQFFILTKKIDGVALNFDSLLHARALGQFLALLHTCGVYHADLHPTNILFKSDHDPNLIDVQEVYRFWWLPRRLRIHNLGKLTFQLFFQPCSSRWLEEFLRSYNQGQKTPVTLSELRRAMEWHRQRRYRSRAKRCCKNSSEFKIVKTKQLRGYRRKDFIWKAQELHTAMQKAIPIKPGRVFLFKDVCIKVHQRKLFHRDRCLLSWKMSRALEVRNIPVPRALGYFKMNGKSFFLAEYLTASMHLNQYLSSFTDDRQKCRALKKLAQWLKIIHSHNIWQRDFKSNNVLCRNGEYFLLDLEGIKIRQLSRDKRIVNLAQLNASVSNAITVKDRLRFFHSFSADEILSRNQRRAIYEKVWEITKTKTTTFYNLDLEKLRP